MFTIRAYHNPYLRVDQHNMQAVLSIGVEANVQAAPVPLALAIALDRSGSMEGIRTKAARDGAIKLIQALDKDMTFVIVAFNDTSRVIFGPATGNVDSKKRAIVALHTVYSTGGTRMSTALNTIVDTFGSNPLRTTRILFLTDGKNEGEQRYSLDQAVARCRAAHMSINAWGIGTDWDVAELRHMADATLGSADIIPDPELIGKAFATSFSEMRRTAIPHASMCLWSPVGVKITNVQQVFPIIASSGAEPNPTNPRQTIVSLGSLAAGDQRDYLLDLEIPVYPPGQQFLMVRPSIKHMSSIGEQEEKSTQDGWVFVQWTEDAALAAQIEEHIAHYTNQEMLSQTIKEGQAALAAGNTARATRLLGQALEMSERSGNERITRLLSNIVLRDAKGTIHLNTQGDAVARKTLAINIGRTSKLK